MDHSPWSDSRSRRPSRLAYGIAVACLLIGLLVVLIVYRSIGWRSDMERLESRYGIEIVFDDVEFSPALRAAGTRYRLTLAFERRAALDALALDLSRYPDGFVGTHLDSIVLLRSLEIAGRSYGGTYDAAARRVYLDSGWLGDDGSGDAAMGFHHEFSSLLMVRYPDIFDSGQWVSLNPDGFAYRYAVSDKNILDSGDIDLVGDPDTWALGFLCRYGMLTLEDDINTFAQYLVADKQRWSTLVRRYPALGPKIALLKSWYCEIGALANRSACADSS